MILLPDYEFQLFAINRFGVSVTWDAGANNRLEVIGVGYQVDDTANASDTFGIDPGSGTWAANTAVLLGVYDNSTLKNSKIFGTLRFRNNVSIASAGSIILKAEWADDAGGILPSSRPTFNAEQHGKFIADVHIPIGTGDTVQSLRIGF